MLTWHHILLIAAMLSWQTATVAQSQAECPWEQALASIMTIDDIESANWEDTYDALCELEQHPINLNTATREDLEAIPFLSAIQVEGIMEYLYNYGPMKSMNELRMIRSLDHAQIALLPYFTYVETLPTQEIFPRLKDILQYGRHELMGNVRIPCYQRKGDEDGYLGYSYRHWLRYQFSYHDYVKFGIVGSQDAGEPFFTNQNSMGYDFYSYYLQIKHLGRIENAVAGKYKLSVGMGLVLNNSFGLGKLAVLQQLGRNTNTVRPHSSRSQTGYFQGAAATVRLSPYWQLTTYVSYRALDATLNNDGTMRTIVTDGYHRTPAEMEKKDNTHAFDAGTHVTFRHGGFHAGATALYTHFNRELLPLTTPLYRRHYANGNDFINLSADYGYQNHLIAFSGETATNRDGALATINSLNLRAADGVNLMLLQRFYSYRYTALYARSLTEGGHVQNESAVYLGASWQPSPNLRLQAYTDYAYFAWPRYGVSQSSHAWDNLLMATYSQARWRLAGRYRLHLRQKDDNKKTSLVNQTEHRGRLLLSWNNGRGLTCATQADAVGTYTEKYETGYMISESVGFKWRNTRLNYHVGYFHTDSYDARLYVYEQGPLYTFSFPAYYGEGIRLALMVQANINRRLSLTAKTGFTHYFDRSSIGSGLQQIDSSSQTDLDLQFRWNF